MPEENDGENASGEPKSESPITAQIQPTGNQNIPTKTAHDDSGNDKDETAELAREIRGGEKWLIGIGIATLLINSVIALIYWGQLKEMRKATSAETQASQTAKDTLTEMRSGSGAQDTHTLAQQAVTQANQTTNLAKAANTQTAELQD